MRLLVVTTSIDRSEAALYGALAARPGWDLDVLCEQGGTGREAFLVEAFPIRHRLDFAAAARLRARLSTGRFDAVYAPSNRGLAAALRAVRRSRAVLVGYRGTLGHLSRWDPAARMTYFDPRVDRIVCVSEAVRRYLLGFRLPPDRLVTIYKGHDPVWYDALPRAARAEIGIPDGAFLVGFAGTIRPVKGVAVLVRAFERLAAHTDAHLLLVGAMRDRTAARRIARAACRERIHVTGYRPDAAALTGLCDCFVMPTLSREGLPRAVIEAMAQCIAPVVTRVGGMPELVEDGVSGYVVPPADPAALAAVLQRLAADAPRRAALGGAARARIETVFRIERTIDAYAALFASALLGKQDQGASAQPDAGRL
jgi:glycosyltransferase involved in cell wall biosynthesis